MHATAQPALGAPCNTPRDVLGEDLGVPLERGIIVDEFDAHGAHVCRIPDPS